MTIRNHGNEQLTNTNKQQELERIILREKDPLQKTLGLYELRNPSTGPHERTENRAEIIPGVGLYGYKTTIIQDRIGTDFTTNQPIYTTREYQSDQHQSCILLID